MSDFDRFRRLPASECLHLLTATQVGRVAWNSAQGPQVLPVAYAIHDKRIVFRTSARGPLAELADPHLVAFEVDAFDEVMRTGWSVVARGESAAVKEPEDLRDLWGQADLVPWAAGSRNLFIRINPDVVTGRMLLRPVPEDDDDWNRVTS